MICDLLHFARLHPRMDAREIHAHALRLFEHEIADRETCDCAERSWSGAYHHSHCPPMTADHDAVLSRQLLDALATLTGCLSPRKIAPALKAAGYATDIWLAAHRSARSLIARVKRQDAFTPEPVDAAWVSRRSVVWVDDRYKVEIRRDAPPPMASAQLVLKVYPVTSGKVWDEPYQVFAVDEGRVIELENEAREQ